jgi:hypothetical protein
MGKTFGRQALSLRNQHEKWSNSFLNYAFHNIPQAKKYLPVAARTEQNSLNCVN